MRSFRSSARAWMPAAVLACAATACGSAPAPVVTSTTYADVAAASPKTETEWGKLPTAKDWKDHLEKDLMRFWMTPAAMGKDGDFPTYRCNDGSLFNAAKPCRELADPVGGIVYLDREYLRMKSRQTYAYGVAYNMTGEEKYLALARQGAYYLMKHGFETVDGKTVPISFLKGGKAEPRIPQRTSQDMAYSLTGLGFYYHLTRDPEALRYIKAAKNFIFETYYDGGQHIIRWVNEGFQDETTDRWELTAHLDQIYGYMIWLTPALPLADQDAWIRDMKKVSYIMKDTFYAGDCGVKPGPACGLFWGDATPTHAREVGANHTDYGHSVKTMWMIYTVGKRYGDETLKRFGFQGAVQIMDWAYDSQNKSWLRAPGDASKEWWSMCELDQTAGSLGLENPFFARYLSVTFKYYKEKMVDKEHGEVWHLVSADGKPDPRFPKQHAWKNGMHSTEHALVGYITAGQILEKRSVLHFAWKDKPDEKTIKPYVYDAKIEKITEIRKERQEVTFTDIK